MPKRKDGQDWVCYFTSGGSEAVDLGIQLARTFTGRQDIVSLMKSYHGMVGAACGATAIGHKAKEAQQVYPSMSYVYPNDTTGFDRHLNFGLPDKIAAFI